jgi:hypothetical protein
VFFFLFPWGADGYSLLWSTDVSTHFVWWLKLIENEAENIQQWSKEKQSLEQKLQEISVAKTALEQQVRRGRVLHGRRLVYPALLSHHTSLLFSPLCGIQSLHSVTHNNVFRQIKELHETSKQGMEALKESERRVSVIFCSRFRLSIEHGLTLSLTHIQRIYNVYTTTATFWKYTQTNRTITFGG